jgi:hypothetical protein
MFLSFLIALVPIAMPAPQVLNRTSGFKPSGQQSVAERLRLSSLAVKSRFGDGKSFRYQDIEASTEFKALAEAASELREFKLSSLKTREDRIAFWVNVYNSLVIHAVTLEVKAHHFSSVWDVVGFFDRRAYDVGGRVYTLNDIEHGILRANRTQPYGLYKPFGRSDPRQADSLKSVEFDPRIHFALNCASHSCPPFAFLRAESLDRDLERAKCGFIESETRIDEDHILTSKIFDWYAADFKPNVREFLVSCLDGERLSKLKDSEVKIKFAPYDWRLNRSTN